MSVCYRFPCYSSGIVLLLQLYELHWWVINNYEMNCLRVIAFSVTGNISVLPLRLQIKCLITYGLNCMSVTTVNVLHYV